MLAYHYRAHPESRLFHGRLFFLGGSAELRKAAPGVSEGDLSGIAAVELAPFLRPYTFPPLDLALEPDWDRKLSRFAEQSCREPITLVGGVPSWLLMLFQRLLDQSGKATIVEVWPELEVVVHGGVKFDPYREAFRSILGSPHVRLLETYVCSEAFVAFGDPRTELLRLVYDHGVFFEFVPVGELDSPRPTRHWLGNVERGVNYALDRLDVRRDVGSRDRRHHPVRVGRSAVADVHRPDPSDALGIRGAPDQRGAGRCRRVRRDGDGRRGARLACRPGLRGIARLSPVCRRVPRRADGRAAIPRPPGRGAFAAECRLSGTPNPGRRSPAAGLASRPPWAFSKAGCAVAGSSAGRTRSPG